MFFLKIVSSLFVLAELSRAAPTTRTNPKSAAYARLSKRVHQSEGDEFIVIVDKDKTDGHVVLSRLGLSPQHVDVLHTFDNAAFRGFSARMRTRCLDALVNMTDVLHIESTANIMASNIVRTFATWGLQRISSAAALFGDPEKMSFRYTYQNAALGSGVDIYVVDTGVNVAHEVFSGRARMGYSVSGDDNDLIGHGTHCAGTAAAEFFGVASEANIIGVKTLGGIDGSGTTSDAIAGINYVINEHTRKRKEPDFSGSVMSMSWGLGVMSSAIQTAIDLALEEGIHVSIAAGNDGHDACTASPSAAGGTNSAAVVVGSIDQSSRVSSFSNTGPCVDIYAPGEQILSSWIGGTNVINFLSGTSMATPAVSGVMAYLLAADKALTTNPPALKARLLEMSLKDIIQGNVNGGNRFLLNNGVVS